MRVWLQRTRRPKGRLVWCDIQKTGITSRKAARVGAWEQFNLELRPRDTVICFVRHPLARFMSCCAQRYPRQDRLGVLSRYAAGETDDKHLRPISDFPIPGRAEIYKLENADVVWPWLMERFPGLLLPLKRLNVTRHPSWQETLQGELLDLAFEVYGEDLTRFDYEV